jgi:septal ring factor EnvC (AmiA/AmiB activator)
VLCIFVFAAAGFAQNSSKSKKDLENKKKKINEEISEINKMIIDTRASKKSSIGALITINMKIEKREDLINTINAEIAVLTQEIKANEKKAEILKANLARLKAEYARMLIFAQRNQDTYNRLMYIFASESFNQAYSRIKYFQQYSEFRKKQARDIAETQSKILANLNELKEQRHEKNVLLGNEVSEKEMLANEKNEQEQVLTDLQQREKDLKKELEKKKQESIELQLAIKKLIAEEMKRRAEEMAAKAEAARKAKEEKAKAEQAAKAKTKTKTEKGHKIKNAPPEKNEVANSKPESAEKPEMNEEEQALSADFANNHGKLPWPVSKGVICEGYGEHEHPALKGFTIFNYGVEICSGKGTAVRAVFEGEVTAVALMPTGGKLVIIKHGEYSSVYSNLTDVQVKKGDKVSIKQPIGTIIHDDDEGKTSMNFQIWKGQKTMDPGGWLYKAY